MGIWTSLLSLDRRPLSKWRAVAGQIIERAATLRSMSDDALLSEARRLRGKAGLLSSDDDWKQNAFALAREAARRTLGYEHFPVQIIGGLALAEGCVVEMQTGEGKTLTATLPLFLRALEGRGCHAVTSNDYLARRDAEQMRGMFGRLALTVGCLQNQMPERERRDAYRCDITYATASELGFDFLRDRMRDGESIFTDLRQRWFDGGDAPGAAVQRERHFALIDEADSLLIDEARTPLIIGVAESADMTTRELARWSERQARQMALGVDFVWSAEERAAHLTDLGYRRSVVLGKRAAVAELDPERIASSLEQALTARLGFQRDRDYVVVDGALSIVDESTGRMMQGRQWQAGLHQALETRERIPITAPTRQAARITLPEYFRRYRHVAGMSGTAVAVEKELKNVYRLPVVPLPTHRLCRRVEWPTRVFRTAPERNAAAIDSVVRLIQQERSVLIGTPSIAASETVSAALLSADVPHAVLNARSHAQEAGIVAAAGQPGRVTIATNMAGRGTDILLHPAVAAAGGLHVIATAFHISGRIDRQLIGRCARQGDPGSFQFLLSLDDELLQQCPEDLAHAARWRADERGEVSGRAVRLFQRAQRRLERLQARERRLQREAAERRKTRWAGMRLDPYLDMTDDE